MPVLIIPQGYTVTDEHHETLKNYISDEIIPKLKTNTKDIVTIIYSRQDVGYVQARNEQGYLKKDADGKIELVKKSGEEKNGLYPMINQMVDLNKKLRQEVVSHYAFPGASITRSQHDMNILMWNLTLSHISKNKKEKIGLLTLQMENVQPCHYFDTYMESNEFDIQTFSLVL